MVNAAIDSLTYKYIESGFGAGYYSGEVAIGDLVMDEMSLVGSRSRMHRSSRCTKKIAQRMFLIWRK